jgi:hypothetical protein
MPGSVVRRSLTGVWLLGLALAGVPLEARAAEASPGERAMPALRRVGIAQPGKPGALAVAVDASGGLTEALQAKDGAHERFAAGLAAAVDATRWLDFGAWVGGRYDLHPRDSVGNDDGLLFQSELSSRLAFQKGALGYGLEATAWLPGGSDVGASLSALSADGKLLLSGRGENVLVAGNLGYRFDRSARAAGEPARLRFGDRSALGASDYDALLAGLGIGYSAGRTLLFGEASAQLLLGSPKLMASPLWLSLGVRRPLGPAGLSGELVLDGLLSARPDSITGTALGPIEPRVTLSVGLRYRFGEATAQSLPAKPAPAPAPAPAVTKAPPAAPPSAAVVKPTVVELELLDDRGQPLPRAQAVVTQAGVDTPLVETSPGRYRLDGAHPGRAHLRIQAEGFRPIERDIDVEQGAAVRVDVKVEPALPAGQVRGLVRSFRGKPLAATVHVEPGGGEAKTDAEGFFQLDVPPGEYEVVIESPGYRAQRRKAKVDQQGVVIVNADLSQ